VPSRRGASDLRRAPRYFTKYRKIISAAAARFACFRPDGAGHHGTARPPRPRLIGRPHLIRENSTLAIDRAGLTTLTTDVPGRIASNGSKAATEYIWPAGWGAIRRETPGIAASRQTMVCGHVRIFFTETKRQRRTVQQRSWPADVDRFFRLLPRNAGRRNLFARPLRKTLHVRRADTAKPISMPPSQQANSRFFRRG